MRVSVELWLWRYFVKLTQSNFDDVGDFHEKFDLDNVTHRGVGPRDVPRELIDFRVRFLEEELQEFKDAVAANDVPKMFDALLDLTYVAMGTAHLCGFPWDEGWAEVQRANMAKVRARSDGSDSTRNSAWDVVKPEGWEPPDLEQVLMRSVSCPQCQRTLDRVELKEVIVDRAGTQWVHVHCECGHRLQERPA